MCNRTTIAGLLGQGIRAVLVVMFFIPLSLSAQVLHPETVDFYRLKSGFSFNGDGSLGFFYNTYPVISAGVSTRVLFNSDGHILGAFASCSYQQSGIVKSRNDGVADARYYYRILDFLYAEAFVSGSYNEQRHIDYMLFTGAGCIMPMQIFPELTVNIGALGGYAWYSSSPAYLSSPGIIASVAVLYKPLENLQFTLYSYLQIIVPRVVFFNIPVNASVDIMLTKNLSLGLLYTLIVDVVLPSNRFSHDVTALIRVKL
ncbi:MAG: hypothetical protein AABZ39_05605 [Spirochaetota bacterium]